MPPSHTQAQQQSGVESIFLALKPNSGLSDSLDKREPSRPENVFLGEFVMWSVIGTLANIFSWKRKSAYVWPPVTFGKRLGHEV